MKNQNHYQPNIPSADLQQLLIKKTESWVNPRYDLLSALYPEKNFSSISSLSESWPCSTLWSAGAE
jgi:hypothetical protein